MRRRVTITIDEDLLKLAEARVAAGEARSLSAFIADATEKHVQMARLTGAPETQVKKETLADVMRDIMAETGNYPTAADDAWAREALGLWDTAPETDVD